jgi:hypothetical protein
VSNIAHLFSMRTNGLSLKPRDRPPPGRLLHSGHGAPRNFLQPSAAMGNLFHAHSARSMDNREIRRLQAQPEHARLYLGRDNVTYQSNGACGFVKRRLRTGSPMLMSTRRLELACSEARDVLPRSFPNSSCVWRVKAQVWFCVKFRQARFCNASKGHILRRDFPDDAGLLDSTVPVWNLRLSFCLT